MRVDLRQNNRAWYSYPGYTLSTGYIGVRIARINVLKHHLIWHTFREDRRFNNVYSGDLVIDHINSIRTDNRIDNLQLLSRRDNVRKAKLIYNTPEYVQFSKRDNKYRLAASVSGVPHYGGSYATIADAVAARGPFLLSIGHKGFLS